MNTPAPAPDPRLITSLEAFIAGFVDTVGFVALFGLFTAHVTGNFVLIGVSLADEHTGHAGIIAKLLALPMFVLGVAATRAFLLVRERRQRSTQGPVIVVELVLLIAFMLAGVAGAPFVEANGAATIAVGWLGVATMAVQNAASRTAFAHLGPTTVMTGNVTQFVIDLVELAGGVATPGVIGRLQKTWPALLAFALGAVGGGLGYRFAGFWALLAPCAALAGVLALVTRRPASTRAGA